MSETKLTREEAASLIYNEWEKGETPANFTEDHSDYEKAIEHTIENGYFDWFKFVYGD